MIFAELLKSTCFTPLFQFDEEKHQNISKVKEEIERVLKKQGKFYSGHSYAFIMKKNSNKRYEFVLFFVNINTNNLAEYSYSCFGVMD